MKSTPYMYICLGQDAVNWGLLIAGPWMGTSFWAPWISAGSIQGNESYMTKTTSWFVLLYCTHLGGSNHNPHPKLTFLQTSSLHCLLLTEVPTLPGAAEKFPENKPIFPYWKSVCWQRAKGVLQSSRSLAAGVWITRIWISECFPDWDGSDTCT